MTFYGSLQVVDRDGWTKSFPLEKALFMLGSASVNDIVLPPGSCIAPVHLQVIRPEVEANRVRVVNLSSNPLILARANQPGTVELPPNGSGVVSDGDQLRIGDYTLSFSVQAQRGMVRSVRSENLGLTLELPGLDLRAGKQLAGRMTLSNFGSQNRCQFEVDLEGLPPDCYQIDPAPMLFPHGEEPIGFRLFHNRTLPLGGECQVILRATAPTAYPTEEVELRLAIQVAPVQQIEVAFSDSPNPPWQPLDIPPARSRNGRSSNGGGSSTEWNSVAAGFSTNGGKKTSDQNSIHVQSESSGSEQPLSSSQPELPSENPDWFSGETDLPRPSRRMRPAGKNIPVLRSPAASQPASTEPDLFSPAGEEEPE